MHVAWAIVRRLFCRKMRGRDNLFRFPVDKEKIIFIRAKISCFFYVWASVNESIDGCYSPSLADMGKQNISISFAYSCVVFCSLWNVDWRVLLGLNVRGHNAIHIWNEIKENFVFERVIYFQPMASALISLETSNFLVGVIRLTCLEISGMNFSAVAAVCSLAYSLLHFLPV